MMILKMNKAMANPATFFFMPIFDRWFQGVSLDRDFEGSSLVGDLDLKGPVLFGSNLRRERGCANNMFRTKYTKRDCSSLTLQVFFHVHQSWKQGHSRHLLYNLRSRINNAALWPDLQSVRTTEKKNDETCGSIIDFLLRLLILQLYSIYYYLSLCKNNWVTSALISLLCSHRHQETAAMHSQDKRQWWSWCWKGMHRLSFECPTFVSRVDCGRKWVNKIRVGEEDIANPSESSFRHPLKTGIMDPTPGTSTSFLEQSLRATSSEHNHRIKLQSQTQGSTSKKTQPSVVNPALQVTSTQSLVSITSSIPFCPSVDQPYDLGIMPTSEQMLNYRYSQLLEVIKEMSHDLKPVYAASSRTSSDRFKRGMTQAKLLVRECLLESERSRASSNCKD